MKAVAEQVASGPGWFVLHISTPNVYRPYLLYVLDDDGSYVSVGRHIELRDAITALKHFEDA